MRSFKNREHQRKEREHMDKLITAHMLRQRQKSDFNSSFEFKAPNKHLPCDLKEIEDMKQYLVLNGIDELELSKYLKNQHSSKSR